ncbi:hypothetical protein BO71DRAFT_483658 [Aspergillus ellipticus CBS 707.79]|uniref:Uncharacterized protein n=1 Tax=Aspergillus ellipticus CBS 707.79 TaxID=1448320 RepID=A0A319DB87_9EURO|nr:hypothetical protein BO71DRAFT_483658 [Aspergillus ellipticus CBS 707.79]
MHPNTTITMILVSLVLSVTILGYILAIWWRHRMRKHHRNNRLERPITRPRRPRPRTPETVVFRTELTPLPHLGGRRHWVECREPRGAGRKYQQGQGQRQGQSQGQGQGPGHHGQGEGKSRDRDRDNPTGTGGGGGEWDNDNDNDPGQQEPGKRRSKPASRDEEWGAIPPAPTPSPAVTSPPQRSKRGSKPPSAENQAAGAGAQNEWGAQAPPPGSPRVGSKQGSGTGSGSKQGGNKKPASRGEWEVEQRGSKDGDHGSRRGGSRDGEWGGQRGSRGQGGGSNRDRMTGALPVKKPSSRDGEWGGGSPQKGSQPASQNDWNSTAGEVGVSPEALTKALQGAGEKEGGGGEEPEW